MQSMLHGFRSEPARVVLFGDGVGLPYLIQALPNATLAGIVMARNRPQYHEKIQAIARQLKVPVFVQPRSKDDVYKEFLERIESLRATDLVCFCYSMLVGPEILRLFGPRAVNVHASLLPKNRGPNPVQWALIRGEKESGLTLHQMGPDFDSGPILAQAKVAMDSSDTWVSVMKKIDDITPAFLRSSLKQYLAGVLIPLAQDQQVATKNFRLTPDFPKIEFETMSDEQIYNLIRAQVEPLAGAYYLDESGEVVRLTHRLSLTDVGHLRQRQSDRSNRR